MSFPAKTDALMQLPHLEEDKNKAASQSAHLVGVSARGLYDIIKGLISERFVFVHTFWNIEAGASFRPSAQFFSKLVSEPILPSQTLTSCQIHVVSRKLFLKTVIRRQFWRTWMTLVSHLKNVLVSHRKQHGQTISALFIYLFFNKLKETKKYSEIKMYNKQYIIHICKRSKDCLFLDKGLALVDKTLTLQSEDLIWL